MGKKAKQWKTVLSAVPDQDEPSEWFQDVLKAKDARRDATLEELADEYNGIRAKINTLDASREKLTAVQEALSRRILEELDKQKIEKITLAGQTFSERVDVSTKVVDRQAFINWIKATHPDYLTVQSGHVKTIVKEALDPENVASVPVAQRNSLPAGLPGSGKLPPGINAGTTRTLGRVETK